ncbi:MAG TPA: hypothetical protein VHK45_03810 [Geminicoccaceae bacterium]|nr:hypothetical protein [Geminicoccaceae bacterium]
MRILIVDDPIQSESDAQFESACDAASADFWLEETPLGGPGCPFLQQRFSL